MALADFLQNSPNFINPDYATPGQLNQAREYAKFLMKPGEGQIPVKSWQAGLANALNQGMAGWELGKASRSEGDIYNRGQDAITQAIAQQLQNVPPQQIAPQPQQMPPTASVAPPPNVAAAPNLGPQPGTPNSTVANSFADVNDAVKTGVMDPQGANNLGPDGLSASPYQVASLGQQSPAPPLTAAATPPLAAGPRLPAAGGVAMAQADPRALGQILMNPFVPKEAKDYASSLIQPKPYEDVYGRPGVGTVAGGVRAQPVAPGLQPGIRAPVTAGDVGTTQFITPPGTSSPAPGSNVPGFNGGNGIDALAAKSRELGAAKTLTQGGATAQAEGNQDDIRAATAAPQIIKGLGLIKNIIQTSPGVTFGPTAGWSAEAKRVIANYAPGLTDEKSLAGADAIEKLNFGLASQLAKTVGGTQGELFKAIGSTPGTEKSKEGTMALIDMMQQDQMKAQQLGGLYRQLEASNRLQDYPAAREKFLTEHPTVNPLSGKPIEMDIKAARANASNNYEKTATNPTTGEKVGLRNGKWEPIK